MAEPFLPPTHKILLVCCSYDGYILEEDGHIESQINSEYLELNMSNPPSFTRVSFDAGEHIAKRIPSGASCSLDGKGC